MPTIYYEVNPMILTDDWPLLKIPIDVMQRKNIGYS